MNKKIKVSVIIPVYNAEKYINKCIESVINQTLKDIEIICINDGSTDDSINILKEYDKKYRNFRLINQENKGVISARLNGYSKAKGEYIAWLDNDDFIESIMLEKMYNLAKKEDLDLVECNYKFYPNNVTYKEKWFNEYKGVNDWNFLFRNTLLWNKLAKKEYLDSINFKYLLKEFGEGSFSIVMISTNKIATINEELYNYRVGHESLSHNYNNLKWYKNIVDSNKRRYEYLLNNNCSESWLDVFMFTYLYYVLIFMVISCYNNNKELYLENKNIIKKYNLFSNRYKKYLKKHLSPLKYLFMKYVSINNYSLTTFIVKRIL